MRRIILLIINIGKLSFVRFVLRNTMDLLKVFEKKKFNDNTRFR